MAVYASWNGATTVASWQLLAGADAAHLTAVSTTPDSGFETAIPAEPARLRTGARNERLGPRARHLGGRPAERLSAKVGFGDSCQPSFIGEVTRGGEGGGARRRANAAR